MSLVNWIHWNNTYADSLPQEDWWWESLDEFHGDAEIVGVYADGYIEAIVEGEDDRHHVYVMLDPKSSKNASATIGCTCSKFIKVYGCKHLFELHSYLLENLPEKSTHLSRSIIQDRFSEGSTRNHQFNSDRSDSVLQTIAAVADNLKSFSYETRFPDWSTALPELRNAWDVRIGQEETTTISRIVIEPILQRRNKAGSGYLKGERVAPEYLLHYHNDLLSEVDRDILSIQTRLSWRTYSEDAYKQVFLRLTSSDNVFFEGKPLKIQKTSAILTVEDFEGRSQLVTHTSNGKIQGRSFENQSSIFQIDPISRTLWIIEYPPNSVKIFNHLCSLPSVAPEKRPELIQQLVKLQSKLPVLLPESDQFLVRQHPLRQLLLLRSDAQGTLEYGLRIQCLNGAVALPGSMPTVVQSREEDRTVQWIRSPQAELTLAMETMAALDLKANLPIPFSGSIRGYEPILRFIERLDEFREKVEVLWDNSSKETLKVLGAIQANQFRVKIKSKRDWFQISGECELGEANVSLEALLQKLDGTRNPLLGQFINLGEGRWASISEELRDQLSALKDVTHLERGELLIDQSAAPVVECLTQEDIDIETSKAWDQCLDRLERSRRLDIKVPDGLKAELRDYQLEGYVWMRRLAEWGIGGILADDMGLGKTLQAIALLLQRSTNGPSLVLAPTSVGFNWIREICRFAPELNPILYREGDRKEILTRLSPGDIVVSSYAIALRDKSELSDIQWNTFVCDEAQAVKNAQSKTAKVVANLKAEWSLALTGTPIENHLGELWSIFHIVAPGIFGSWESFRKKYASPIEKDKDLHAVDSLSRRIKPFVLRRTKTEVLHELPPRTESTLTVELSDAERAQYELVRRAAIGELETMMTLASSKDRQFRVFTLLTRLRQYACHPGIVNKQWDRSSAKLDLLCEKLVSLREEGHRALVFSQFTEHLALIRAALEQTGISYEYLDGSTPANERQRRVDDFQNGSSTAFLISLKAGGTGLNLTAADYVIHMDPWWNPAVEDQATDRAHRMGQTKSVMVYRIIAKDTIEEQILALHASKRDLVDSILQGTNSAASLSIEDLANLIRG